MTKNTPTKRATNTDNSEKTILRRALLKRGSNSTPLKKNKFATLCSELTCISTVQTLQDEMVRERKQLEDETKK